MGVLPGEVDFDCAWPVLFACCYVDDMATWLTRQTCFQNTKLWTLNHDKEELFTPNACAGRASTGWAAENNQSHRNTKGYKRAPQEPGRKKRYKDPMKPETQKGNKRATKRQPTNLGPKRNHFGNFRCDSRIHLGNFGSRNFGLYLGNSGTSRLHLGNARPQ